MKGYDSKGRYFTNPASDLHYDDYPLGDSATPVCGDFTYREIDCSWWLHETGKLPYEAYCTIGGQYLCGQGATLLEAQNKLRPLIDNYLT